jgi:hypothetical protein
MRGIADAEQARSIPLLEAVDANGQKFYGAPIRELIDTLAQHRREAGDVGAKRR